MADHSIARHRRRLRVVPYLAALVALGLAAAGLFATKGDTAERPLRYHADARHFLIGSGIEAQTLVTDADWATLLGREFNYVTPDHQLTWDATEPARGAFTFVPGDAVMRFAQGHSQKVRGHTLVWHSRLPAWLTGAPQSQLLDIMRAHITGVAGHYSGQMHAWDVVTEPLNEDGTLRDSLWLQGIGPSYIGEAFRAARSADPTARLYLTDDGIEGVNPKSDAVYELVKSLRRQGVPIDGVGFQTHLTTGELPPTLERNIERFAALGVEVAITELDVRMPLPATTAKLRQQAADYRRVIGACLAFTRCVSLSVSGLGDKYSWIPDFYPEQGAASLYDDELEPKPAYRATRDVLSVAAPLPRTSAPGGSPTSKSADQQPPSIPGTPTASVSGKVATVSWPAATDNTAVVDYLISDAHSDVIQQRISPEATISVPLDLTVRHTFWVVARDGAGNLSQPSDHLVLDPPPPVTASPTPPEPTCRIGYILTNQWPGGYQAEVRITNTGPTPINGWTLTWTYTADQMITQAWSGSMRQTGSMVTVTNVAWNATIAPQKTISFGYLATTTSRNARPTGFALNGLPCSG